MKHGEGPDGAYSADVVRRIRASLDEHFAAHATCKAGKSHRPCGQPSVPETCFCAKHYADERKDFLRSTYETHGLFVPRTVPVLPDFDSCVDRSWDEFNRVLTRPSGESALNTLSLIIEIDASENFDLDRVMDVLRDAGDTVVAPSSSSSFNNVVEFTALVESDVEESTLHNASVKLWHNRQIHVCGCRNIRSALKLCSSVVRVLKSQGICPEGARVTAVNPVFANASFEFFPQPLIVSILQSHAFLESMRRRLDDTDMSVSLDATGYQRTTEAVFCFTRPGPKSPRCTTIKIYPRGNVIITFNNFDGRMLQRALQVLAQSADEHKAFLRVVQTPIVIDAASAPKVFTFSPRVSPSPSPTSTPTSSSSKRSFSMSFLVDRPATPRTDMPPPTTTRVDRPANSVPPPTTIRVDRPANSVPPPAPVVDRR